MADKRNPPADGDAPDEMEQLTGKGGVGESGGGAYPNPHTGKSERSEKRGFVEGGQSENRYFGPDHAQGNAAKGAGRDNLAADPDPETK